MGVSAVWPPVHGVPERVYSPVIALRKMATRVEFADSEAQSHLQALMAIVGRQSLSKSSPARSSHNFSTREQDNQQQQQQTSSSSSSSSLQGLSSRPPTTRKRSAPRTPDKLVRRRPSVPVFVGPKTTPMKQLNEMARSQVGIYGEERKELLQAFEETRTTNIMMESESPQQAEAAPAPSTEQPQEKLLPLHHTGA